MWTDIDILHVVPVGDNAVLNGVLEGEDTTLGLGLVTDIQVLLAHANHHAGVARWCSVWVLFSPSFSFWSSQSREVTGNLVTQERKGCDEWTVNA
jgi:hypothetical protein